MIRVAIGVGSFVTPVSVWLLKEEAAETANPGEQIDNDVGIRES